MLRWFGDRAGSIAYIGALISGFFIIAEQYGTSAAIFFSVGMVYVTCVTVVTVALILRNEKKRLDRLDKTSERQRRVYEATEKIKQRTGFMR